MSIATARADIRDLSVANHDLRDGMLHRARLEASCTKYAAHASMTWDWTKDCRPAPVSPPLTQQHDLLETIPDSQAGSRCSVRKPDQFLD